VADFAAALRQLADRVGDLEPAELAGQLEQLRFTLWRSVMVPTPNGVDNHSVSDALDIDAVATRTGMSRQWLYRQARKGALPFARRLGRRLVFDEAGLARWLDRQRAG